MKFEVKFNSSRKYNYELVITNDDGSIDVRELNQKTTDNYLRLPMDVYDATNRHYVSLKMLDELNGDTYVIEPKSTRRVFSTTKNEKTTNFAILEYLTDDEKQIYNELYKKAIHRYNVKQITDEIERLEAKKREIENA